MTAWCPLKGATPFIFSHPFHCAEAPAPADVTRTIRGPASADRRVRGAIRRRPPVSAGQPHVAMVEPRRRKADVADRFGPMKVWTIERGDRDRHVPAVVVDGEERRAALTAERPIRDRRRCVALEQRRANLQPERGRRKIDPRNRRRSAPLLAIIAAAIVRPARRPREAEANATTQAASGIGARQRPTCGGFLLHAQDQLRPKPKQQPSAVQLLKPPARTFARAPHAPVPPRSCGVSAPRRGRRAPPHCPACGARPRGRALRAAGRNRSTGR